MTKILFNSLIFVLISYSFSIAQFWKVENQFERDVIIVVGTADTEVLADEASFNFTINGYAKDLNTAVANARKKVDQISKELFKIGLNESNLTTSQFRSSENKGDKAFLSSKRDFIASMKVQVRVDSLDLLEPIMTAISLQNPDYISDISFRLKDIETVKMNTLQLAVEKAREKATKICDMLNIKLGSPTYIEEIQESKNDRAMLSNVVAFASIAEDENTPMQISSIFIETIKVTVSVRAIFSINQNNGQ